MKIFSKLSQLLASKHCSKHSNCISEICSFSSISPRLRTYAKTPNLEEILETRPFLYVYLTQAAEFAVTPPYNQRDKWTLHKTNAHFLFFFFSQFLSLFHILKWFVIQVKTSIRLKCWMSNYSPLFKFIHYIKAALEHFIAQYLVKGKVYSVRSSSNELVVSLLFGIYCVQWL